MTVTTTTAWENMPNARHIDAVLTHVVAYPMKWDAAWDAAWGAAWGATLDAAWYAARCSAWDVARDTARDAARDAAWDVVWDDAWGAARDAAWDACCALVAWDDAGQLMEVSVDAVRSLAATGHHAAILLLPARLAMETS